MYMAFLIMAWTSLLVHSCYKDSLMQIGLEIWWINDQRRAIVFTSKIVWSAKKQPTVSQSSTKAKYRALASTAAELIWLRMLLQELCIPIKDIPLLWCENLPSIRPCISHSYKIYRIGLPFHTWKWSSKLDHNSSSSITGPASRYIHNVTLKCKVL